MRQQESWSLQPQRALGTAPLVPRRQVARGGLACRDVHYEPPEAGTRHEANASIGQACQDCQVEEEPIHTLSGHESQEQ